MSGSCGGKCGCGRPGIPDAVEFLKQEHRVIERVLDALEIDLQGGGPSPSIAWPALEFLAAFADGCHHHKEEEHLFPALRERGVPQEHGPIGCMLDDHETGRALMKRMRRALIGVEIGDPAAVEDFRDAAQLYIDHLRRHIDKEDHVLFAMAADLLSPAERARMADGFYDFERVGDRPGTHDRMVVLADVLHRRACAAAQPAAV